MSDLGACVGAGIELERALVGREDAINGDVSIGVTVERMLARCTRSPRR